MANRQYVGARYVPKFYEGSNGNNWENDVSYEPLTVVQYMNDSYTSKKPVPNTIGSPNHNPEYWAHTGAYNAQVEQYRQEVIEAVEDIESRVAYATPQMYGAKADGITDDSDAINECLAENDFVIIPAGIYAVGKTIELLTNNRVTVICATKTIFKAITNLNPVIEIGVSDGWEYNSFSWTGGMIDCGGFSNCCGMRINRGAIRSFIDQIQIENLGNNGIGLGLCDTDTDPTNYQSLQLCAGSITIKNYSGGTYEPNKFTRGVVAKAFDYEIFSLYIYGCTIGIDNVAGNEVHISNYHYWLACSPAIPVSESIYEQTIGVRNNGVMYFDLMYVDMAYIMTAGRGSIQCDNTHWIGIKASYIATSNTIKAYMHRFDNRYSDIDYGLITANYNDIEAHTFINNDNVTIERYVYEAPITCEYKYTTETYLHAILAYSLANKPYTHNFIRNGMSANQYYLVGYVPVTNCVTKLSVSSTDQVMLATCEIIARRNECVIRGAKYFYGAHGNMTFGVGNIVTIDGFEFYPIVFKVAEANSAQLFVKAEGNSAFYIDAVDKTYSGTASREAICYYVLSNYTNGIPFDKTINLTTGVNSVSLSDVFTDVNEQLFDTGIVQAFTDHGALHCPINAYNNSTKVLTIMSDDDYTDVRLQGLVFVTPHISLT